MKTGPWVVIDGYCAARVRQGGDVNKVGDRVAFIEKTPRVRFREHDQERFWDNFNEKAYIVYRNESEDHKNWGYAPFKGDDGFDQESREWCDKMLVLLGWELEG